MLSLAFHRPRVGYALLLLPALVGATSGAPGSALSARTAQPAPARLPSDRPTLVAAAIPCISGTCQVQVHAPVAAPIKPLPARPPSALPGAPLKPFLTHSR